MGILLFNKEKIIPRAKGKMFSSPRWGFLYLMLFKTGNALSYKAFSSPLWGFLYLIIHNGKKPQAHKVFSSPHWGFFI